MSIKSDLIPVDLPVKLTDLGLSIEGDLAFEEWSRLGEKIGRVARISLFWVGDWLNYGQDRWNGGKMFEAMSEELRERYHQAMRFTGLEFSTLKDAAHVARRIPLSDRSNVLSFEHHRLLSRVKDDKERRRWLKNTSEKGWSTTRLRKSINAGRMLKDHELKTSSVRSRKTHLFWIEGLVQWWQQVDTDPRHESMTREQLETVLRDFEPIEKIVAKIQERTAQAKAFLDV